MIKQMIIDSAMRLGIKMNVIKRKSTDQELRRYAQRLSFLINGGTLTPEMGESMMKTSKDYAFDVQYDFIPINEEVSQLTRTFVDEIVYKKI